MPLADFTDKPGYTFPGVVPKEAQAFFRAKGYRVGFSFLDVFREEHATAFTVAKAMEIDILETIRQAADQALADGQNYRQFARELMPQLERLGWTGRQDVVDPATGEIVEAELGTPRRLKLIYRTNLRTARAAGQWDRAQRTKRTQPYLLYELGPSENHREEHVQWAGIILPIDDPWWQTHYPPNGWGCKCRVRQISRAEYKRLTATGRYRTTAPNIETRDWTNRRTGEVLQVPAGIDPGWDTNPGQLGRLAQAEKQLAEKSANADF